MIAEGQRFLESPAYAAPDLPDLRAAIQADIDHEVDDPESVTNQFRALLEDDYPVAPNRTVGRPI